MNGHGDTGWDRDDDEVHGSPHAAAPGVYGLVALAVGFGGIGVATGFATVLGITATASGGSDVTSYGAMAVVAVSSLVLGVLLVAGGALLWRAHRAARAVIGAGVALLAVSSLARMTLDEITFVSALGSVLSLVALVVMGMLLVSDDVKEHVRRGEPLSLR